MPKEWRPEVEDMVHSPGGWEVNRVSGLIPCRLWKHSWGCYGRGTTRANTEGEGSGLWEAGDQAEVDPRMWTKRV